MSLDPAGRPKLTQGRDALAGGARPAAAARADASLERDLDRLSGLQLWPAATCLISELAEELDELDAASLRRTDVVLPTGRLSTWLLAMLAARRGAFVPPRCLTRDEFIERHAPPPLAADGAGAALLTDLEEELLLAGLLKDGRYRHLALGHAHEVRQLFAELVAWDLDDCAWERLTASVAADIYRSELGLGSLQERVDELRDLHARYGTTLASLGATTPRQRLRAASRRLAGHLAAGAPLAVDRLFVVGFTSMEKMHGPLLHALARRPEAAIWLTEPPPLYAEPSPVQLLIDLMDQEPVRRQPRRAPVAARPFAVHRAPGVLAEAAHALALAAEAIADGVPPSGIALLVTDDKTYGRALRTLLPGMDFDVNVALAAPLATTLHGTWLAAMLAFATGEQTTPEVLALLTHPLTRRLVERGQDAREPWSRERATGELLKSGVPGGLAALLCSPALSTETRQALLALKEALGPLMDEDAGEELASGRRGRGARPFAAWAELFAGTIRTMLLSSAAPAGDADDIGLTLSTTAAIESFLAALTATATRAALAELNVRRSEFLSLVGDRLLAQEVRSVGDPLRGVQILSVEEARYVPFDLLIVLGAAEGQFPRAVPRDYLLDNFLKTRIGLPGWQLAEAIEDTTFLLLRARLPALVLLYPATRGGEPVVRSRFIEAALVAGEAVETTVDPEAALLACLQTAVGATGASPWRKHVDRRLGAMGALPLARRAALASPMSASALQTLVLCPYRFLLARLGVSELAWAEEDDARTEGDWLHQVMEAFFTGKAGDRTLTAPLDDKVPWDAFRAYALERLVTLTDQLAPSHAEDSQTLLHLRLKAWPAFVTHLMTVYDGEPLASASRGLREHAIGAARRKRDEASGGTNDAGEEGATATARVTVRVGTVDVELTGLIDAVDQLSYGHLITDYKRSYVPDKRAAMEGLAPQLPLYALALAAAKAGDARPLRRAVIGYWSILSGTWEGIAAGAEVRTEAVARGLVSGKGGQGGRGDLEEATDNLMDLWSWRFAALFPAPALADRQGATADDAAEVAAAPASFGPDPSRCELCGLSGVCRRDDPEAASQFAQGDALNRRLAVRRREGAGQGKAQAKSQDKSQKSVDKTNGKSKGAANDESGAMPASEVTP